MKLDPDDFKDDRDSLESSDGDEELTTNGQVGPTTSTNLLQKNPRVSIGD